MIENKTKISIIMPSLNVVSYIAECMDSVIKQTLNEIEIICIDAESNDGTWEILQDYAKRDSRVVLLRSNLKSYGHQVNLGLKRACGKYVAILETDDFVSQSMYEELYICAEKEKLDYVKAGFNYIMQKRPGKYYVLPFRTLREHSELYEHVICPSEVSNIFEADESIWTGIYRRSFLVKNNIQLNESMGAAYQDIGFVAQVITHCERAIYLERPMYQYRVDRDTASMKSPYCLKYALEEVLWILDTGLVEKMSQDVKRKFRNHVVAIFLGQLSNALKRHEFILGSNFVEPYYKKFRELMMEWLDFNVLTEELCTPGLWKRLNVAIYDPEKYIGMIKNEIMEANKVYDQLRDSKFCIFGCGIVGKRVLQESLFYGIEPVLFVDNNEEVWGTEVAGLEVNSLDICEERYAPNYYVIANLKHKDDIIKQLLKKGIDNSRVIVI